ncbi:hypothetical protein Ahy_A10g048869 [Arachis hypogaea]|uniref:Uncharacterized protein n=1 Tax=Arachis hypogaea TaxID=3818 RepID=A0A445B671_ARAHY|nr:hypothetical protein Ahy_A10g048869 [Arachis hypogaea]
MVMRLKKSGVRIMKEAHEISKGGFRNDCLPSNNSAFWFSKATFERFVRSVSTPAILERFISLEKEILQIKSSVQANALLMSSASSDEGTVPQANGITRRLTNSAKEVQALAKEAAETVVLGH